MAYIYDLSDTWNAAGTTFFGIKMNVTNSASASGSKLLSLQVASTEYFGVDKNGNVTIGNGGDLRISSATGGDDSIIYNDAEDLYFNTNGAVRAVINSTGNVGIGTSSPLSKATVSQSGTVKLSLESQGSWNAGVGADASGNLLFYNPLATERMRVDSSGNVGIGTTAPGQKLEVVGGIAATSGSNQVLLGTDGAIEIARSGGGAYIDFRDNTSEDFDCRIQSLGTTSPSLVFSVNGGERARINSSGNVGIGTSSPGSLLEVNGNTAIRGTAYFGSSLHGNVASDSNTLYLRGTNIAFQDSAGSGTYAYINSSGNFGIGTGSPKTRLQASAATTKNAPTLGSATDAPFYLSNSDTAYGLVIGNSSADGRVWFQAQRTDSSATAYNITLNEAGGQVLVGTANAFDNVSYLKFQSLGGVSTKIGGTSLTSQMSFFNDNGRVGWIGTDGTTTSYNTSSDARLKENIANADDASSLIDAIQVRKFDWKADGSHQRYGFVAQELIEVAPEAVSAPPEEDQMMAVDYSKLVPMLVKELQSLRARVAQLEGN